MIGELNFTNIVGIFGILGSIAAWISIYPSFIKPYLKKMSRSIPSLEIEEKNYLESLVSDLEFRNKQNHWSNELYIPVNSQLQEVDYHQIPQKFYCVKSINPNLEEKEFNNLTNIEKIDSSRGVTYPSLGAAIRQADENATIVIAPPGSGKTVSLRNLAIAKAKQRALVKTDQIPIFINLGYYTGFDDNGNIQSFENFLEEFFISNGYYKFLSMKKWEMLLQMNQCVFFLDGIDEMPRNPGEYEERSKNIKNFVRNWPNTQFILSCRELDYNNELSFQQILIKPFDYKHIKWYLKKYFGKEHFSSIFKQINQNSIIYDLCRNPFYLNLICLYSYSEKKLPENKVQLFSFLIDQFIIRENEKLKLDRSYEEFKEEFTEVISQLAYYLAIETMSTTLNLEKYINNIKGSPNFKKSINMIENAIKGGLLDYNENTNEIRFIHNRFQEFFSSKIILQNYRKWYFNLPKNFFTNLWWRETIIFVAGLDDKVDDLIAKILIERSRVNHSNEIIERMFKLEMLILSFECIFSNLTFNNNELYNQVRDELLDNYKIGNVLEKAKILGVLSKDKSEENQSLFQTALNDPSHWVSERAFFILSEEQLKIQMNSKSIIKEYWRFFYEGRLLSTFLPTIKSAARSKRMLVFMPFYLALLVINILCMAGIGYVFFSFFRHIFFRMEFAFTRECLGCLATITLSSYLILYFLINNDYPFLKKFIKAFPIAILVYYLSFYLPNHSLFRIGMISLGIMFYLGYNRLFRSPNESKFSLNHITAFLFGFTLLIPIYYYISSSENERENYLNYLNDIVYEFGGDFFVSDLENLVIESIKFKGIKNYQTFRNDRLLRTTVRRDVSNKLNMLNRNTNYQELLKENNISKSLIRNKIMGQLDENLKSLPKENRSTQIIDELIRNAIKTEIRKIESEKNVLSDFYVMITFGILILIILFFLYFLYKQAYSLKEISNGQEEVDDILAKYSSDEDKIKKLNQMLDKITTIWAKKALLNKIKEKLNLSLGLSREDKVIFLNKFAENSPNVEFKDAIYQSLEEEEKNYRRTLPK